MLPRLHRKKGGKNRRALNIVAIVSGILFSCLVLFLALDSFTLYWFTLLNKDSALEARRNEDFEWYDSFVDGATGGRPSGKPAPGYNSNFGGGGYEYAMNEVVKSLTLEEMQTKETAMRFFIYLMDCLGYTPNAIVGAMSYMYQEGAALGTFTYESYNYCTGPSGVYKDFTLDNDAWLKWLDDDGLQQAIVLYRNMREAGKSVGYAAIGLGLTQESDTWKSDGSKGAHRATDLINFANSKGGYWQYPNIQMLYYEQKFQGDVAWDLNDCPGPDPKTSTEITATEWAGRVLCGIGMPGWSYTKCLDSVNYPASYASLQSHIAGVPAAQELYNKYSGKDPWFYNPDGTQIYAPNNSGTLSSNGFTWGAAPCPSCGKTNSSDWHCPFCGPVYDNSTSQGLLIARMALLFAGDTKVTYQGASSKSALGNKAQDYNDPGLNSNSTLQYYRHAQNTLEGELWASCDRFASLCILLSGADPNYLRGAVGHQRAYMRGEVVKDWSGPIWGPGGHPERWTQVGFVKDVQLQPGDILINPGSGDPSGTNNKKGQHIMVWVGEAVANERWPGTNVSLFEASYFEYYPCARNATLGTGDLGNYLVFRCIQPQWSTTKWDAFIKNLNGAFPEIPRTAPGRAPY